MAGLVYRPDRKAGRLVGRSFSTGPLLALSSLEALHSVPKCLVFTIHIGNTTNSAGLNIGMLGIYIKHAWHTFHYNRLHFMFLRKKQMNIGDIRLQKPLQKNE